MFNRMFVIDKTGREAEIHQLMQALPELEVIDQPMLATLDDNLIVFADVESFLEHTWKNPTIVLAKNEQGALLAKAWQQGALAGWLWNQLPAQPKEVFKQLDNQYKRNQDSRDLPAAAKLQQRLLPKPLNIAGYRLEYLFQPSAFLSGDWFDFWQVDDSHILFYLADVSGHGVTSSLLTSWMAAFHGRAKTPAQLIRKLNRMLVDLNGDKHITLLCGLLNYQSSEVELYSAGHYPPAILLQPDTHPTILTAHSSFPLGLTDDLKIQPHYFSMTPGARLVLCSDGALEPFEGGLNDQFDQLVKILESHAFKPPESTPDDIAILSISRLLT